ncbi:hypothetical protein C8J57DRAFT_1252889 [Mycena rebaudengoi]|nr:hypothetical protein C8J57DRAFT_1252889 [Mycena rebaudengoi]
MWLTAPGASGALRLLGAQSSVLQYRLLSVMGSKLLYWVRATFSACKTGLFGLGLGSGRSAGPKRGISACKPICRLGTSQKLRMAYYTLGPNVSAGTWGKGPWLCPA